MNLDRRSLLAVSIGAGGAVLVPTALRAQASEQQRLVDRARLAVEDFLADKNFSAMGVYVQNAYGAMIFPELFKAGFFVGAQYGRGVLLARDLRSGEWSDPAFYELYGGSLGLQFGGKSSDVVFTLMNQGALNKVLTSKFTFGTDASVAAGPIGGGVGAGTTAQFGEDVYIFARDQGLFGGLAVDGNYFQPKTDWNAAYYGRPVTAREIVLDRVVSNSGAAELRAALARF